MIVTVGGLPGTGTSTLCKLLGSKLGLPYVYAGQLFRDEAAARGMSLPDFGDLCETDPAVDQALDAQQVELLHSGNILLEGRLSGRLAVQESIPALKVWLTCDEGERMRRITERDGADLETQRQKTLDREASERARYQAYYRIDLDDLSAYDLVLDSSSASPAQLAAQVLAEVNG